MSIKTNTLAIMLDSIYSTKYLNYFKMISPNGLNFKPSKPRIRKKLVEEEKWTKLDDWFMGKPPEKDSDLKWRDVLAHQCDNGKIRAPSYLYILNKKITGKCSGCGTRINDKVKQIIFMTEFI